MHSKSKIYSKYGFINWSITQTLVISWTNWGKHYWLSAQGTRFLTFSFSAPLFYPLLPRSLTSWWPNTAPFESSLETLKFPFNANFQLLFAPSIPLPFVLLMIWSFSWVDPQYLFSFSSFFCLSVHPCLCFCVDSSTISVLLIIGPWVTVLFFILCSHIIHHWMQPPSPLMFEMGCYHL